MTNLRNRCMELRSLGTPATKIKISKATRDWLDEAGGSTLNKPSLTFCGIPWELDETILFQECVLVTEELWPLKRD